MTIPGINVYSACTTLAEADDISRFPTKENASYAEPLPGQQSGDRDMRGHISKRGPSVLRSIMVNAAHKVIKCSKRMRGKHLSLVGRIGKNRATVAVARILLGKIFIVLTRGEKFIDGVDELAERKIRSMEEKAREAKRKERRKPGHPEDHKIIKGNLDT